MLPLPLLPLLLLLHRAPGGEGAWCCRVSAPAGTQRAMLACTCTHFE
jgi:hypothetical protein